MTSNVKVTVPSTPNPTTKEVRDNFATIKQELEALQAVVFGTIPSDSPVFTGTIDAVNASFSGSISPHAINELYDETPLITAAAPLSAVTGNIKFKKYPDGLVRYAGKLTFSYTNASPGTAYQIIGIEKLSSKYRPDASLGGGTVVMPIIIIDSTAINYIGMLQFFSNGSVLMGWALDRNTAAANVTGAAAQAYCYGSYDATGSV